MAAQDRFGDVVFDFGKIHVKGGALKKAMPMDSKQVLLVPDQGSATFVRLSVNEPWLMMAVTGQKRNHALGRTSLLTDLHEKIRRADGEVQQAGTAVAVEPARPAVAGQQEGPAVPEQAGPQQPDSAVAEEPDPMDALECVETPKKKHKADSRPHRKQMRETGTFLVLDMPDLPLELWHLHRSSARRAVRIYQVGDSRQIWLELQDVPWAIRFLYLQNKHQGVPAISDDDVGPSAPSSISAVAEQQPASVQSPAVAE